MFDFFKSFYQLSFGELDGPQIIEIDGKYKTYEELRQELYERTFGEAMYIARASEGAISVESILQQPIFLRKKYVEDFKKELQDRQQKLERQAQSRNKKHK